MPTGRIYHQYINPDRAMPIEAFQVHGLGDDFLRDKPRFAEIATAFLEFIGEDSRLVIHNAGIRHEVPERRTELGGSGSDRQ
jgi:DNA polymerase-3 subunit epsilon